MLEKYWLVTTDECYEIVNRETLAHTISSKDTHRPAITFSFMVQRSDNWQLTIDQVDESSFPFDSSGQWWSVICGTLTSFFLRSSLKVYKYWKVIKTLTTERKKEVKVKIKEQKKNGFLFPEVKDLFSYPNWSSAHCFQAYRRPVGREQDPISLRSTTYDSWKERSVVGHHSISVCGR